MLLLDNEETWIEMGAMASGWGAKNTEQPVSLKFADILGSQGWEMFNVVQYGTNSVYFFKREIE